MNPPNKIVLTFTTILIPLFLVMTAIRILINPFFLTFEYNKPNFPADPYGFTKEDRFRWATPSLLYLTNNEDISYLEELKFDDGTPIYNERELSHMVDVKNLVQTMISAWFIISGLLILTALFAYRGRWIKDFWLAVSRGGWSTIAIIVLILAAVAISFNALFTGFHRIFFTGDTWLFYYTDTLIRLFPIVFWQDAFIFMGVITALGALILGFLGRRLAR